MLESSATRKDTLVVKEIFCSLQGESRSVGWPTVFVRLTGCPLRCSYCDTAYAFSGGEALKISQILEAVAAYGVRHVTLTGGEPLAQSRSLLLLSSLCDQGYEVSLETSGSLDIAGVDSRVVKIVDFKTPASGEMDKNHLDNIAHLTSQDQVKFVIQDRADYEWAVDFVSTHTLSAKCEVLFSPVTGKLNPTHLADWIVEDRLAVRFQLQLHKILWGDQPGK
ncbi:MAG: 7-carboxy-7-deazaguanine synthase QueE [Gammaproteobacteria bacterium]|nr:7-carboxy-7-deazaguanine synthase QueE [Gammaproteobacteria bacterium]MDH5692175.1 7-carboxy-7-deazaguanine synthase QueE [Gammaproteobacteria bacterium]